MIIHLVPQMRLANDKPSVTKSGDVLTLDGDVVDLSIIPEGAELPASAINNAWFADVVRRVDGVLHVSLILPHSALADESICFPADIVDPADGVIALPEEPAPVPSPDIQPEPPETSENGDD